MVDAKRLLADLKRLRRQIEDDLRQYHRDSRGRAAVEAEWREAFDARRTADTFETFWSAALDQAAVHWILGLVFLRFLEDNGLVDRPLLSGPGERLELAELRQREFFRARPHDSDAEYLLETFDAAAKLPGLAGLYDPAHNSLFRLPVSGDGAMALIAFFRDRAPDTGELVHDFSDPDWNTRFLGDLYQDLSEDARKRYALLQTPEFVEEWILSRTLDPAIGEFGFEHVRMIDPACGSGHFLLGGFARVLAEWQRHEPGMPPAAQAQKALDAVAGVDLNPFAVEIARFRLLLVALRAAGLTRLAAAPDFRFSLAIGDSLFHGRHFFRQELGGAAEGFGHVVPHHYYAEDTFEIDRLLGRQYHAVVGNPPYITPKDAAMRDAYRGIYPSCHMKYALAAPFIERFFDLAQTGSVDVRAGFVGMVVADNFTKREFGSKLIEEVLPHLDLTHVADCSDAHIPGHGGTGIIILFGRNRAPISDVIRTVMRIRGETTAPEDPAHGPVWHAITTQMDRAGSVSEFVSVEDVPRATLARHPWSIGGGGAAEVQEAIEGAREQVLHSVSDSVGFFAITGEDECYTLPLSKRLCKFLPAVVFAVGDEVRDFHHIPSTNIVWPYREQNGALDVAPLSGHRAMQRWFWPMRTNLKNRLMFGKTPEQAGQEWWEYRFLSLERVRAQFLITFGEVATHNHFVLVRGGKVFKQTAPVIKLRPDASEDDHLGLLGLLNSSTACFWLKQVCYPKGGTGLGRGITTEKWEIRMSLNGANVEEIPITSPLPLDLARTLDTDAQRFSESLPGAVAAHATPSRAALDATRVAADSARARMIALQEELDWHCYRLYSLLDNVPKHPDPPGLRLGERAFEIVMARRMAAGDFETAWFTRHGSTPITDLPAHWAADYRQVVERRIVLIESDPTIGLIERPEYKRRWSALTWEQMEQDALRTWLLDRLEDARHWPRDNPRILSSTVLADSARRDTDFLSVAALYVGREAFDLETLVADLVVRESVPFLTPLRYSETGLRKRADWEATWDNQREEDAIDADLATRRDEFASATWARRNPPNEGETPEAYAARMAAGRGTEDVQQAADAAIVAEAKRRKREEVGEIPVPPKYKKEDFSSVDFWRLRGGLDVPKERFVSFPHCARDADPALPVLWAGYDHAARAKALADWYVDRKDTDGWAAPRLVPLLAGLLELVPWLLQWHNGVDAESGQRMGDYFAEFVDDEARELGLTLADLRAWAPPARTRRPRGRRPTT
jgi:hypothetical protein